MNLFCSLPAHPTPSSPLSETTNLDRQFLRAAWVANHPFNQPGHPLILFRKERFHIHKSKTFPNSLL